MDVLSLLRYSLRPIRGRAARASALADRAGFPAIRAFEPLEPRQLLTASLPDAPDSIGPSANTPLLSEPLAATAAVTFADPALEAAVRETLNKPTGDLTDSDMLDLTELYAGNRGITSLEGLQAATSLTTLELYRNQIDNIAPLAGLTSLTDLSLVENNISDLAPLSGLTSLQHLDLWDNPISSLQPLSTLGELRSLFLGSNNQVSSLAPLSSLTRLSELTISGEQISSLAPLASLQELTNLTVGGPNVQDLSPLAGLSMLQSLFVENSAVADIAPLASLTALANLSLDNNQVRDLAPLAGLGNLAVVYLNQNLIKDVAPLAGLSKLSLLGIESNFLDLTPGSEDAANLAALRARGVVVYDTPQFAPVISISGTSASDGVIVEVVDGQFRVFINRPTTSQPDFTAPVAGMESLVVNGGDGDDTLTLLSPLPFAPAFNGGAGVSTYEIRAGDVQLPAGAFTGSGPLQLAAAGDAQLTLTAPFHLHQLAISDTAEVRLAPGGNNLLHVDDLLIGPGATLDIVDNSVIVDHADADGGAGRLAELENLVRKNLPGPSGAWLGPGIISSAASENTLGTTTVGILSNNVDGAAFLTEFAGQFVDASSILLKYTYYGDTNLDGEITGSDYAVTDAAYWLQTPNPGWINGDSNLDGAILGDDYAIMDLAYWTQPNRAAIEAMSVPADELPLAAAGQPDDSAPARDNILVDDLAILA